VATGTSPQGDRPEELALNRKNSGFLPEERAWLTDVFDKLGWVDVFRRVDPRPEQYTWWSNRRPGRGRKNVGWRIDYQIATPGIAAKAKKVAIYKDKRFSITHRYDRLRRESVAARG